MSNLTEAERALELQRAFDSARASLKIGDRIKAYRCGGIRAHYVVAGFTNNSVTTKMGLEIHPLSIFSVNGKPVDFSSRSIT